jgi:hypothetical protein
MLNIKPCRNKIIFNGKDLIDINKSKNIFNIINIHIKKILHEYYDVIPKDNSLIEIQANNIDYNMSINGFTVLWKYNYMYFKEIISINDYNFTIYRGIKSFHQTDDNIRLLLYNYIDKFLRLNNFKTGIFLGGETYLFGKIFSDLINNIYYYFY